ncbi:uncharacterized protein LOC144628906 isoform X2 [Oculina patagonica]
METFCSHFLVLLALCILPSALSLQCYECTNSPGFPGVTKCDNDNVTIRTCDRLGDRCLTMKYNFSLGGLVSLDVWSKNCSNSVVCYPQFKYNYCKVLEITGLVSNCTFDCCQGDLCNGPGLMPSSTTKPITIPGSTVKPSTIPSSTIEPTSSILGLAASFGTICLALLLTVFAVIN